MKDISYCYALKKLGIKKEFNKELKHLESCGLSLRSLAALAVLKDDKKAFRTPLA